MASICLMALALFESPAGMKTGVQKEEEILIINFTSMALANYCLLLPRDILSSLSSCPLHILLSVERDQDAERASSNYKSNNNTLGGVSVLDVFFCFLL